MDGVKPEDKEEKEKKEAVNDPAKDGEDSNEEKSREEVIDETVAKRKFPNKVYIFKV